jgi:hypothetical protein
MGQTVFAKKPSNHALNGLKESLIGGSFPIWHEGTSDVAVQLQPNLLNVLPISIDPEQRQRLNEYRAAISTVVGGLITATEATSNLCVVPVVNVYTLPFANETEAYSAPEMDIAANAISREVLKEMEAEGIKSQMYLSLAIAKKSFSTLHDFKVTIEHDPEIQNAKKFEIHLIVKGSPETVFKDEQRFKKNLRETLDKKSLDFIVLTYAWKQ